MATVRLKIDIGDGKNLGQKLEVSAQKIRGQVLAAVQETLHVVSDQLLQEGRADIASAGNFGSRWTEGLQVAEDFGPERSTITIFHTVPYWRVFELGATIHGKPLLWIPLSFSDAVGTKARDYGGGLFRVDRKSGAAPLLLSRADKQPKYVGKESVTIPKKFHLREIGRRIANGMRAIYRASMTRVRNG